MTETAEPEEQSAPEPASSNAAAIVELDAGARARLHHHRRDLRRVPGPRARHRRVARAVGHVRVARHQGARRDPGRVAARRRATRGFAVGTELGAGDVVPSPHRRGARTPAEWRSPDAQHRRLRGRQRARGDPNDAGAQRRRQLRPGADVPQGDRQGPAADRRAGSDAREADRGRARRRREARSRSGTALGELHARAGRRSSATASSRAGSSPRRTCGSSSRSRSDTSAAGWHCST